MANHYRSNFKKYKSFPKTVVCDFCDLSQVLPRAVRQTEHAFVVPNRVFYDIWEQHDVVDHLLVLPKRHVHSLSELTDTEMLDIMRLIAEYEEKEYNVYARAKASARRSVMHQHTHLIKIDNNTRARATVYVQKPHLLIKF